jgi:hypothetical protein
MTHHWDDQIADVNSAAAVDALDSAERLVAEDEPIGAGRRLAVVAVDDLTVRSADADGEPAHQHASRIGNRDIVEPGAVRHTWAHGQRAHVSP